MPDALRGIGAIRSLGRFAVARGLRAFAREIFPIAGRNRTFALTRRAALAFGTTFALAGPIPFTRREWTISLARRPCFAGPIRSPLSVTLRSETLASFARQRPAEFVDLATEPVDFATEIFLAFARTFGSAIETALAERWTFSLAGRTIRATVTVAGTIRAALAVARTIGRSISVAGAVRSTVFFAGAVGTTIPFARRVGATVAFTGRVGTTVGIPFSFGALRGGAIPFARGAFFVGAGRADQPTAQSQQQGGGRPPDRLTCRRDDAEHVANSPQDTHTFVS